MLLNSFILTKHFLKKIYKVTYSYIISWLTTSRRYEIYFAVNFCFLCSMFRRSVRLLHPIESLLYHKVKFNSIPSKILFSVYDKDLPNPSLPTPANKLYSHDTDILLEQIRRAKTVDRLLELTSLHLDVMNAKHIVECMQSIHNVSKGSNFSNQALTSNEIFQGLCSRLMKTARFLDPQDVITVYKALSTLGIKNNTYVMQSILKMMGSHINNMTLGQLTFLHFLLSKQKPNSLVDGLKLALPLVLQVQIEQQLDSDNISEIVNCFQLACRSRLKPSVIEKVLAAVLQKAKLLTPNDALTVSFALLNLNTPVDGYKELINYCFTVLSDGIDLLTQSQAISLLRVCRNQGYYNSRFFFATAKKVIKEKWNLELTYDTSNCFNKLNFAPDYFTDYFVDILCAESDMLKTKLYASPLTCLEYITQTGYQPKRIKDALEVLCSCEEKISKLNEISSNLLLKFVSCLSLLGYFPQQYLEKVLDEEFLLDAWSISKKQGRFSDFETSISSLICSLQVYEQQKDFHFPPRVLKKFVSTLCQRMEDFQGPLEKFIQHGIGGSQFLLSGLFTENGIFIDHVLAMRSGNYPVALQSSSNVTELPLESSRKTNFVEDLKLPEDIKVVTLVVADEDKFCRDPEVLQGWMNMKIQCLKKMKYCPVVINYSNFKELPDREKIPFLMREIKVAVEEDSLEKSDAVS